MIKSAPIGASEYVQLPSHFMAQRPNRPINTDGHEGLYESYNGQMIIMKIIIGMIRTNNHNNNINNNIYNDHFYFNLY